MQLIKGKQSVSGSLIGGIQSTQELINLCHNYNIYPDVEMVPAKLIDECWHRMLEEGNRVPVRFVLDVKESLADSTFSKVSMH